MILQFLYDSATTLTAFLALVGILAGYDGSKNYWGIPDRRDGDRILYFHRMPFFPFRWFQGHVWIAKAERGEYRRVTWKDAQSYTNGWVVIDDFTSEREKALYELTREAR